MSYCIRLSKMKRNWVINLLLLLLTIDLELCEEDIDSQTTTSTTVKPPKFRQRIVEGPSNMSAILSESVTLKCKVANQAGSVVWSKRAFFLGMDRALAMYPRYSMIGSSIEGEYDLQIQNVQLSDEDVYRCQILAGGPEQPMQMSEEVKLTVLVPPTAPRFIDGESLQGREGYSLTARCISRGGKPEASLEFYISTDMMGDNIVRQLVQDSPHELMTHNELTDIESSITFTPESYDDGKFLICAARHPAIQKPMITSAKLEIKGKPKIRVVLESAAENLIENGYAILSCQDYSDELLTDNLTTVENRKSPSTLAYQWSSNGHLIEGAVQSHLRLTNLNRTSHHGSEYTCRAENDIGQSEATYKLNLRYSPRFKSIAEKFIVSKGETITFSCLVDSNPAPLTYKWTKTGGVGRFSTTFGQNLSLDNVQPNHEGSYTCEVTVDGFPTVRQTHQLFVKGHPKVVIENVPDAVEGGSAKIACKITGRPKSHDNVTWYKGRSMISTQMGNRFEISTSRINDDELYSILLIRKVLTIDFDTYNCTASNLIGLSWAATRLIESTNVPLHFMMPGVVGGVLAILVIALAIVWANKKYICRSKSSTASDVQVTLDDLTPKYNTSTYTTGPMIDSMEGIVGKSDYVRIPQENPDFDDRFYTQHLMPYLTNGTLGRQLGSPVYPRSVQSLTPPPPHPQLLNDHWSLNGSPNTPSNNNYDQQQQPFVHQSLNRVYSASGQQVPHFSIQQAKNYAHLTAGTNNNNGVYSTFGRYPQHQISGEVLGSADNLVECKTGPYRYSPQQQFLNGAPSYRAAPSNYAAHLQSNLTLLEAVPEVATPEMMDDGNVASVYDNNGGMHELQRPLNRPTAYHPLEVVMGDDGRPIHRCASQLSTHV